MQFCIENLDQAGGCTYNYSCAYTDSISWASPNEPLPMIRDPRVAFDMLFGSGAHRRRSRGAARDAPQHPRLDRRRSADACAGSWAASDRTRLDRYLENVREIERRIQAVEAHNSSGERARCPTRRPACPTRSPST